jgi:hypothetical protein
LADIWNSGTGNITAKKHAADPYSSTKYVVNKVRGVVHARRASHRRAKRADDRNKAGQNHGTAAIFLIKVVGSLEVAAAKEERVFAAIQSRTGRASYPVAQLVADNGAEDSRNKEPTEGQDILAGEDAGGDQKGIAGKKEAYEKPRFQKNDDANESGATPAD